MMKFKNRDITEKVLRMVLREAFGGDYGDEDELSPFEEYQNDYPNDDFDVSSMTPEDLAEWCRNAGDFLYVFEGIGGLSVMAANTDRIVYDIVSDLYSCRGIEPTHEVDYLFYGRERDFTDDYVCIFKIKGTKDGDYYIVYHEDKRGGNAFGLNESRAYLTEALKSNELRQWFRLHGGVKNVYNEPEYSSLVDKRVFQDGLGDVTDEQIVYLQEFNSFNDANNERRRLTKSDYYGTRSDWDMKALFVIYSANDGMFLLVGLDRNKTDIDITWGGEHTKKAADRIKRNGWNMKTRSNRYVDDSDTYYYSQKGRDFGIYDNALYKGKMKDNDKIRGRMSSSEWKDYQDKRVKDMDKYLRKYYHKGIK